MTLRALMHSGLKSGKALLLKAFFASAPRFLPTLTPEKLGINLVGYHRADLGLGEALRYTAKALAYEHIPFAVRDFLPQLRGTSQTNQAMEAYLKPYCAYPINCLVINPDLLYRLPSWITYPEWAMRYNIAYWFWELPNFPKPWRYAISLVDEIWVNTEFNAKAMAQAHQRVIKIPFAVEFAQPSAHLNRAYFALPDWGFLFLCSFDFNSAVARKNPGAVIEAFLSAFSASLDQNFLIVKSVNGHLHPEDFAQLKQRALHDPRILFIDRHLSSEETHGLLQCADCYVSLHRSEGLGLGMAESMYLGKPVIATAYSGNLEFMNEHNACLIAYTEVAVSPKEYPHAEHQVWANANLKDAALAMQRISTDAVFRNELGSKAHAYMRKHHSFVVMGNAITKRLKEIAALLS